MIKLTFLLASLLAFSPLFADDADSTPPSAAVVPSTITILDERNAVLRGIATVSLEVGLSEGVRPEDSDLRSDLRDTLELELRRAGIRMAEGYGNGAPVLRLNVKFDRGAGRYAARLMLSVKDQVTVTRNRETLVAEIWTAERGASSAVDSGLTREIRSKARDLAGDFVAALRKANGVR